MCLAKAFLKKDDKNELVMADIASVEKVDGKLVLTTLFRETKEIEANIKKIDFANSSIMLESAG
ncbi:CooT family nickel-binding protein [Chloroflexota bacterium]